jgi:hypothetical protein
VAGQSIKLALPNRVHQQFLFDERHAEVVAENYDTPAVDYRAGNCEWKVGVFASAVCILFNEQRERMAHFPGRDNW